LTSRWQISAGGISEWLPPFLFALSVLASAWVLYDARRRDLPLYAVAAWTLATLLSPPVVLPLYLIARLYAPKPDATGDVELTTFEVESTTSPADIETNGEVTTQAQIANDADEQTDAQPTEETRSPIWRRNYAPALLYALALLLAGAIYFYRDYHSFDAYLARAEQARLLGRRDATIRSYRAALRISDDAHTRKLLAIQLAEDGQHEAALSEFRAAERGGEPDELLPYRIAYALDTLGQPAEAAVEYQRFLRGNLCARPSPDARCEEASARERQTRGRGDR
jgi:tetratricopeptide (TPR) repeat protein